jgi:hypothetical protein
LAFSLFKKIHSKRRQPKKEVSLPIHSAAECKPKMKRHNLLIVATLLLIGKLTFADKWRINLFKNK